MPTLLSEQNLPGQVARYVERPHLEPDRWHGKRNQSRRAHTVNRRRQATTQNTLEWLAIAIFCTKSSSPSMLLEQNRSRSLSMRRGLVHRGTVVASIMVSLFASSAQLAGAAPPEQVQKDGAFVFAPTRPHFPTRTVPSRTACPVFRSSWPGPWPARWGSDSLSSGFRR